MMQGGDTLTEISPFEAKWVEQKSINTSGWRDENYYTNAYVSI